MYIIVYTALLLSAAFSSFVFSTSG